jgi:hypothetical protein
LVLDRYVATVQQNTTGVDRKQQAAIDKAAQLKKVRQAATAAHSSSSNQCRIAR